MKKTTFQNILDDFRELAEKVDEHDNLVIYFSGHGHYDEITKTGYWIPVDAQTGNGHAQFIDTGIIVARLRNIPSLHTLLIIDSCFSGTLITQTIRTARRAV